MGNTNGKVKSTPLEKAVMGIGNVGSNLCWTFMTMFVTMYYTNSVGLAAATVGTIMLIARILDGISDVVFGVVIEKVKFKMGKLRPWFLISGPLCGIGLWMSFHVPASLSTQGKSIYVFLTYAFVAAVAYTIFNLAYAGIIPLMSHDEADRNLISVVQMVIVYIGMMVMSIVTPMLLVMWGGYNEQASWGKIATIYAILCAFLCSAIGLLVKEKDEPSTEAVEVKKTEEKPENRNTGLLLKEVFSSKYTWIVVILFIAFSLFNGIAGITTYYWTYVFGNFEMQGMAMLISMPLSLIASMLLPLILKKVSREKLVMYGMILIIITKVIAYVFARNMIVFVAMGAISTLGLVPLMALSFTFTSDLIDYFVKKKGIRVEGLASAAFSVGVKIGTGLGGAAVGWGLALTGFEATAEVQTMATQNGIIFISNGIPLVMAVIMFVCVKFWNIKDVTAE